MYIFLNPPNPKKIIILLFLCIIYVKLSVLYTLVHIILVHCKFSCYYLSVWRRGFCDVTKSTTLVMKNLVGIQVLLSFYPFCFSCFFFIYSPYLLFLSLWVILWVIVLLFLYVNLYYIMELRTSFSYVTYSFILCIIE
jgi:hypothetical protein